MNKINPLYVIIFLVFIILILVLRVDSIQASINTLSFSIEKTRQAGVYSKEIKKEFSDKQKQVKVIKSFLGSNKLLGSPHKFNVSKSHIDIKLVNLDSRLANKVSSKVLNTSLFVSRFSIKDVDFNKTMEIKIKL